MTGSQRALKVLQLIGGYTVVKWSIPVINNLLAKGIPKPPAGAQDWEQTKRDLSAVRDFVRIVKDGGSARLIAVDGELHVIEDESWKGEKSNAVYTGAVDNLLEKDPIYKADDSAWPKDDVAVDHGEIGES